MRKKDSAFILSYEYRKLNQETWERTWHYLETRANCYDVANRKRADTTIILRDIRISEVLMELPIIL